jgi:hypothetical protein
MRNSGFMWNGWKAAAVAEYERLGINSATSARRRLICFKGARHEHLNSFAEFHTRWQPL